MSERSHSDLSSSPRVLYSAEYTSWIPWRQIHPGRLQVRFELILCEMCISTCFVTPLLNITDKETAKKSLIMTPSEHGCDLGATVLAEVFKVPTVKMVTRGLLLSADRCEANSDDVSWLVNRHNPLLGWRFLTTSCHELSQSPPAHCSS
jgi:hypothetical protein